MKGKIVAIIEVKLTEETLIALIRGQKLQVFHDDKQVTIFPPNYSFDARMQSSFELGKTVERLENDIANMASHRKETL